MKYTLKDIGRLIRESREITGMSLTEVVNKYKNESGKKFSIKIIGSEIFVIRNK